MPFRFETANERWRHYRQSIMEHPQHNPSGGMGDYIPYGENTPGLNMRRFLEDVERNNEPARLQPVDPLASAPLYMSMWDDRTNTRKAYPVFLEEGVDYTVSPNGDITPSEDIKKQLGDEILTRNPQDAKMWGYDDSRGYYVF